MVRIVSSGRGGIRSRQVIIDEYMYTPAQRTKILQVIRNKVKKQCKKGKAKLSEREKLKLTVVLMQEGYSSKDVDKVIKALENCDEKII